MKVLWLLTATFITRNGKMVEHKLGVYRQCPSEEQEKQELEKFLSNQGYNFQQFYLLFLLESIALPILE